MLSFLGHGQILLVPSGRDLVSVVGDAEALPPLPALPPARTAVLPEWDRFVFYQWLSIPTIGTDLKYMMW